MSADWEEASGKKENLTTVLNTYKSAYLQNTAMECNGEWRKFWQGVGFSHQERQVLTQKPYEIFRSLDKWLFT